MSTETGSYSGSSTRHRGDVAGASGDSGVSTVSPDSDSTSPAWGIGAVAERYGVAANTLRSWDRRYGVGPSQRSEGGHRRYDLSDMQRVGVMARMTTQGVPAATAARVALALESDDLTAALDQAIVPHDRGQSPSDDVEAILEAAGALDAAALRGHFRGALDRTDVATAWVETFSPALQRVGQQWSIGKLGVHAEHLASEVLVSELRGYTQRARFRRDTPHQTPSVVLASADDELHYLPLLALEAHLVEQGHEALMMGPRIPAESLLALLAQTRATVVFLWASIERPDGDPLLDVLGRSTRQLSVVIGGPGWPHDLVPTHGSVRLTQVHTFEEACATVDRRA